MYVRAFFFTLNRTRRKKISHTKQTSFYSNGDIDTPGHIWFASHISLIPRVPAESRVLFDIIPSYMSTTWVRRLDGDRRQQ